MKLNRKSKKVLNLSSMLGNGQTYLKILQCKDQNIFIVFGLL